MIGAGDHSLCPTSHLSLCLAQVQINASPTIRRAGTRKSGGEGSPPSWESQRGNPGWYHLF